ncbi:MAG: hypothetical protein CMO06_17950 [Thalassospira sp.]|nr:hypothetical protein [Thalassospira sp.]
MAGWRIDRWAQKSGAPGGMLGAPVLSGLSVGWGKEPGQRELGRRNSREQFGPFGPVAVS